MKVWSGVKSILERTPFRVKFYIGFILLAFFIMGLVTLHAYIKRPEQIQKLRVYEQKLASISTYKVSEEHFATGRNGQIYVFKNIYLSISTCSKVLLTYFIRRYTC